MISWIQRSFQKHFRWVFALVLAAMVIPLVVSTRTHAAVPGFRKYASQTVGMALSGPNTGGSQYFITHSAQPHLDGIYTIFGRVIGGASGAAVLSAIGQGDRIRSIHR